MFLLPPDSEEIVFPPVDLASPEGLLAVGGDLRSERLLAAYRHGIFPWYSDGQPILWWSPDPRAVFFPDRIHVSRSLRKTLRSGRYSVTLDTDFVSVISACADTVLRRGETGTWITTEMQQAYIDLHHKGYAHSVEVWEDGQLAGGLYGLSLGRAFFGESMFHRRTDASKVALVALARQVQAWGFLFIDAQVSSDHILRLGAVEIRRHRFMELLGQALESPTRVGRWKLDVNLADGVGDLR
jgi:leucyl/phenylalanyl-tRNA--protein transferase